MGILLIDSSSKKIEFGYAWNNVIAFRKELEPEFNADNLTYFIKDIFAKNKIEFNEIEYVGLSNGPGSFTGLRIGSAIAKGICFALGSKLIAIPTLDVIANKFKPESIRSPEFTGGRITSLIFSNTKTCEFYFAEYNSESGKLNRISDYGIDLPVNFINREGYFIINEKSDRFIGNDFLNKLTDVSDLSNLDSLLELASEQINKNIISEYRTSEPFYMKEFVPNI